MLEWQGNSPDTNPIENVWNRMKKKGGNKMPCPLSYFVKNEEMWSKRVCEALYCEASNVLGEL